MKLRNLVISVSLLALLSAVVYLRNRPAPVRSNDPRVGRALLDPDVVSKASGLVVGEQGKKVELAKGADGAWRVSNYYDFPADFEKIARFVQDLNEAKVERFVTENPERLAHLEFKDAAVSLTGPDGKEIWSVTLGKTSESGNGRFLRFGTETKAYFSGLHAWIDTDPKSWANPQLVSVKPEEVAKLEIPFDGGALVELSRSKKDAPWSASKAPAGEKLSQDKIAPLLTSLTTLRFSDTVDPKDAEATVAEKFMRTVKLTTFDGRTLSVSLGRKPEEKRLKAPVADAKDALTPPPAGEGAKPEAKPITPEFETIPAGPTFVVISSSEANAPINLLMQRRAFKVEEYALTGLPQKVDELFEAEKAK